MTTASPPPAWPRPWPPSWRVREDGPGRLSIAVDGAAPAATVAAKVNDLGAVAWRGDAIEIGRAHV